MRSDVKKSEDFAVFRWNDPTLQAMEGVIDGWSDIEFYDLDIFANLELMNKEAGELDVRTRIRWEKRHGKHAWSKDDFDDEDDDYNK